MATRHFAITRVFALLALSLGAALALGGCNMRAGSRAGIADARIALLGRPVLHFRADSVTELELSRQDPELAQTWTARLARSVGQPWSIVSSTGGALIDRRANAGYVRHLLDALETVRATGLPKEPSAGAASLSDLGLSPARLSIRLRLENGETRELELGAPVPRALADSLHTERGSVFALIPDWTNAQAKRLLTINGAALGVLKAMASLESLRERAWASFSQDDIDQFELRNRGRSMIYAQRDGAVWSDRAHKKLKAKFDARSALSELVTTPIERYLDADEQAKPLAARLRAQPELSADFTDRQGHVVTLWLSPSRDHETLTALSSERPEQPFLLPPRLVRVFESARR